jgi:hypothetical protein
MIEPLIDQRASSIVSAFYLSTIMLVTLQAKLQAALAEPCPISVLVLIPLSSFLIAYLAHLPNTRTLRIGLWPVGMLALIWALLTVQIDPGKPPDLLQVRH